MEYNEEEIETIINNKYDYSNIIATEENITYLVQYYDQIYSQFLKLIEEDEQRNEKLKYEFQVFNYKDSYSKIFKIKIRAKDYYNTITCENYTVFVEAIRKGQLRNINSLEIEMNLDYKKGKSGNLTEHQNSFKIIFKPYEISFLRKSNHKEPNMDQIETTTNKLLNQFPVANTIFCTK